MKSKQFITGVILGSVLTSGVGVFAAGELISATKSTDTKIYVDGEEIQLDDDYAILNYNDHVYTPARTVAEALGADVEYIVDGDTKNIYLTSKGTDTTEIEPMPIPTVDPIVEPTPDPVEPTEPEVDYRLPPAKDSGLGVSVLVTEANVPIDETEIDVEITNNNTEGLLMFDYSNFKLVDEDGNEYPVKKETSGYDTIFYSSLPNNDDELEETLKFKGLSEGTNVTLVMPIKRTSVSGNVEKYDIEIPLTIEDYDTLTSN